MWNFLFGNGSSREVRHLRFSLSAPEDQEIVQGQLAALDLEVKAGTGDPVQLVALQYDLINRREERRTLLERLVTQSRFVFRFNLQTTLEAGGTYQLPIEFLPPVCREGSRKTRFVSISWQVKPRLLCAPVGQAVNGKAPWLLNGSEFEIEVQGRR